MKQKGFAPILIVIIITALIGGYLIYQNSFQIKTPPPTTQLTSIPSSVPESTNSAETTNWKTYSKNIFNQQISFEYPSNWVITDDGYSESGYPDEKPFYRLAFDMGRISTTGYASNLSMLVHDLSSNKIRPSIEEEKNSFIATVKAGRLFGSVIDLQISDQPAIKLTWNYLGDTNPLRKFDETGAYRVIKDGKEYSFYIKNWSDAYEIAKLDKLISTFKFLP